MSGSDSNDVAGPDEKFTNGKKKIAVAQPALLYTGPIISLRKAVCSLKDATVNNTLK